MKHINKKSLAGRLRKVCFASLMICLVLLTGCTKEYKDVPCSDQLPNTWGCTYDTAAGKYNCTEGASLRLFQVVGIFTNQFAKDTIDGIYESIRIGGFSKIAQLLILIYVALYGLFIVAGIEQLKLYDAVMKLLKISLISLMFSDIGLKVFNYLVVQLSIDGGNEVVNWASAKLGSALNNVFNATYVGDPNSYVNGHLEVDTLITQLKSNVGVINPVNPYDSAGDFAPFAPFAALDHVLMQLISPKAGAFYEACLLYGISIKGILIAILLISGVFFFFLASCSIVYVYIVCLLGRILLLGLAPIFAIFMIFRRTQQIFIQKWVVQLLSYTFIPAFMVIFLSVMAILINVSFQDIFTKVNPSGVSVHERHYSGYYRVCRQPSLFLGQKWTFSYFDPVKGSLKSSIEPEEWFFLDIWDVLFFLGLAFIFWKSVSTIQSMVREIFGITLLADPTSVKPKFKSLDATRAGRKITKYPGRTIRRGAARLGSDATRLGARGIRRIGGF